MLWRRIRQEKGTGKTGGVCAAALKSTVGKISLTLDKDVKESGEPGMCGEQCSGQRRQQVQRPGGGNVAGIFKGQQRDQPRSFRDQPRSFGL